MCPLQILQNPIAGESVSGWVTTLEREAARWDMHRSFEIGVVLSGKHERYVADLRFDLGPGDVSLNPGWEPHGWRNVTKTTMLVIFFMPSLLKEESFGGVSWFDIFAAPPEQRPRVTHQQMRQDVLRIAHDLRHEIETRQPGWQAALRIGILRLLLALSREWRPPTPSPSGGGSRLSDLGAIAPAIHLVSAQEDRRTTLEDAAGVCSLSKSWFSVIFRRALGVSFGQFALRSRLVVAAHLLATSGLTVGAVAKATGFADGSHLHHVFAQHYGCTPAQYRRREQTASRGSAR